MSAYPEFLEASEASFQRSVMELAQIGGWKLAHHHDSRRQVRPGVHVGDHSAAGFPDLVLCRGNRVVFAELKAAKGRVSPAQEEWLAALRVVEGDAAGRVLVRVWRPSDWPEIERLLTSEIAA